MHSAAEIYLGQIAMKRTEEKSKIESGAHSLPRSSFALLMNKKLSQIPESQEDCSPSAKKRLNNEIRYEQSFIEECSSLKDSEISVENST